MTRSRSQELVHQFIKEHGLKAAPPDRLLDLVSEIGELAKEMMKGSAFGKIPFKPTPAWEEELGDVFFSLLCLADNTDVDLDEALKGVIAKYELRLSENNTPGSGR